MSDASLLGESQTPRIPIAAPSDYFRLLKPRVMSLVVLTALAGLLLAPVPPHPLIAFAALLSIALCLGSVILSRPIRSLQARRGDEASLSTPTGAESR